MRQPLRKKSLLSLLLLIVFVVYAMVLQFAVPDLVLCVGEAGHLAVEPVEVACNLTGTETIRITSAFARQHSQIEMETTHCRDIVLNVLGINFPLLKKTFSLRVDAFSPTFLQLQKRVLNITKFFTLDRIDFVTTKLGNMLSSTILLI